MSLRTFMSQVYLNASLSEDKGSQVGAVIVSPDGTPISAGWNSLPIGIKCDHAPKRLERPDKYLWFQHAESRAIAQAAKRGISTDGATMLINLCPCMQCAGQIVNAGIKNVAVHKDGHDFYVSKNPSNNWNESFSQISTLFYEAGVEFGFIEGAVPEPSAVMSGWRYFPTFLYDPMDERNPSQKRVG